MKGFYLRRTFHPGRHVNVTLSRHGLSESVGGKGWRVLRSGSRTRRSVRLGRGLWVATGVSGVRESA